MPAPANSQPDEDIGLVREAQAGSHEAFEQLVEKHQSSMIALLHRFAPQRADLEDLVQETFLNAWRGLPTWQPRQPFIHWLRKIAVRVGLEACRRWSRSTLSRRVEGTSDFQDLLETIADTRTPPNPASALEEIHFILALLPPEDRTLITLLHLEEMPVLEIAALLDWSATNTKVKAFRARHRLRKLLKQHGYTFYE